MDDFSGRTRIHRYWQRGLALFALMLGGHAIFGFFFLARSLSLLSPFQLFSSYIMWFIASRFLLNVILALLAWGVYRYLRYTATRWCR